MNEELFKAATDFLMNGGKLPDEIAADAKVVFLSAMLKDINTNSQNNTKGIEDNGKRISKIELVLKWAAGLLGTTGTILGILAKLSVI